MPFGAVQPLLTPAGIANKYFLSHKVAEDNPFDRRSSSSVADRIFSGLSRFVEPSRQFTVSHKLGASVSTELIRQNSSRSGVAPLIFVNTIS